MKILTINYYKREAIVKLEGIPDITFCVPLDTITTKQDFIDALKNKIPGPDELQEKFNNLQLDKLQGTDI